MGAGIFELRVSLASRRIVRVLVCANDSGLRERRQTRRPHGFIKKRRVTKAALARQMNTSRAQLDRLLDPENQSVTLRTVARAANILGMKVQIELVQS
jgi:hypothetical protein